MLYIANAEGQIVRAFSASNVFQNSKNANEVILLAPFPNAEVTVAFTLPNGMHTTENLMTPNMAYTALNNIVDKDGTPYGAWQYLLPASVTAYAGKVQVQFYVHLGNGVVLATSTVVITVQKGVPGILPEEPTPSVYAQILEELTRLTSELGSGGVTLVKTTALPTENISHNSIYELTYNGLIYYFFNVNNMWVQLNSSYLYVNAMQEGQAPNVSVYGNNTIYAVMLSEGETTLYYVGADNIVRRILNDKDYNQVVESLIDINQSITETNEIAQTAQALATQAQNTATTAQTTANTAQNTAQEALNKANSVSSAFRPQGSVSTITSMAQPSSTTVGYVYNLTQPFTTTSQFVEGEGKTYPAGTNVAIIQQGSSYYYDVFVGFIDLSGYQTLLVSGTNIKTVNNQSLLGSGNLSIREIVSTAPIYNSGIDIPLTINSNNTAYIRLPLYTGETE